MRMMILCVIPLCGCAGLFTEPVVIAPDPDEAHYIWNEEMQVPMFCYAKNNCVLPSDRLIQQFKEEVCPPPLPPSA